MILQRYILRELVLSFALSFATVMAVCLVGTMFQVFRTFEGMGFMLLVKILPLALGYVASWAQLVATCTATTLVYGRLAAENEINAMRTCGIHANRMFAPALLFGLFLSLFAYGLNEYVVPPLRHNRRVAFREATIQALKQPPAGKQRFEIGPYKLSYIDYQNGRMERPTLMKFQGEKLEMEFIAPSGMILMEGRSPRIVLSKPRYRKIDPKGGEDSLTAESDLTIELELGGIDNPEMRAEDLPREELWEQIQRTKDPRKKNASLTVYHTRFSASLTPLLLVLVAVPIGIFVKRGSRLAGLGAALPPLLVYFVLFFIFQGMGDKGRASPLVAAYTPDAILAVTAAFLMGGVYRK